MRILRNLPIILFAVLLAGMLITSQHILMNTDSCFTADLENVRMLEWSVFDPIILLALAAGIFMVMKWLSTAIDFSAARRLVYSKKERKHGTWFFAGSFGTIILLWLPYILSYVPGGVYSDTYNIIDQASGTAALNNHHPLLYTMIWRAFIRIFGEESQFFLEAFTLFQTAVFALTVSLFVTWLYRKGVYGFLVGAVLFFYGTASLIPIYAISLWKDSLFGIAVFLFSWWIFHFTRNAEAILENKRTRLMNAVTYIILSLLLIFLRNNGIFIFLISSFYLLAVYIKRLGVKKLRALASSCAAVTIFYAVLTGPVYDSKGYNIEEKVESYGILLQQVFYIELEDGYFTAEEKEFLDRLIPRERLAEVFNPMCIDNVKWDLEFDRDFLNDNAGAFLRLWLRTVIRNPVKALREYCFATYGFWSTYKTTYNGYVNFSMWFGRYNQEDAFRNMTGYSIRERLQPGKVISSAFLFWVLFFMITLLLQKKKYGGVTSLLPSFSGWMTIMIATPCAFSFRYVFYLFFLLPLFAVVFLDGISSGTEREEPVNL